MVSKNILDIYYLYQIIYQLNIISDIKIDKLVDLIAAIMCK